MKALKKRPIKVSLSVASAIWPTRIQVDRTFPGRLVGCSIITTGPAIGHGFNIDKTTVAQVAMHSEGLRGRWTHGSFGDDGLARHLGKWCNVRTDPFWLCRPCGAEVSSLPVPSGGRLSSSPGSPPRCALCNKDAEHAHRVVADFAFSKTAHKLMPDGLNCPAPEYLMDRADEDPASFGVSIVGAFSFSELADGSEGPVYARLAGRRDIKRADLVSDPAANPLGLSQGKLYKEEPVAKLQEEEAPPAEEAAPAAEEEQDATPAWVQDILAAIQSLADMLAPAEEEEAPAEEAPAEEAPSEEAMRALSAKDGTIQSLMSKVKNLEAAEEDRILQTRERYVSSLGSRAIQGGGSPIKGSKLDKVRQALLISDDLGRELGESYLAASIGRNPVTGRMVRLDTGTKQPEEIKQAIKKFGPKLNGNGRSI